MKKMAMSQAANIVGGTFKHSVCKNYFEGLVVAGKPSTCYSVKECTDKHGVINKEMRVAPASNCPKN